MLFTHKELLEDMVIRLLSQGSFDAGELYKQVLAEGKKVSIQALYKALRYLISASVIVKSGKKLSVSQEWANNLAVLSNSGNAIPKLVEGESAHYYYKSLLHLDAYWKHLMKSFKSTYPGYPIYLYSPYGIWFHIEQRQESQVSFIREFEKQKHHGYMIIGNDSQFDRSLKRTFQSDFLQVDTWHSNPFRPTDGYTIINDYVITTRLSNKMTKLIAEVYNTFSDEASIEAGLSKILQIKDSAQIKIERNSKKAKALRKKLSKNLYIPSEIKNQYSLF